LKHQLSELEKQYEKSKPLVNLVDNMVKLGSLYRGGSHPYPSETTTLDRLEFNQRIQERRLMQEEQRQWERMSPNQTELQVRVLLELDSGARHNFNHVQTKVQQLYKLDQALQEESGTLQNLQRDKEDLERALFGLRSKLQNENAPSMVVEAARRQQHALEMELSRVHQLLAENSKVVKVHK
jgi:valyl-tRNA synthetase